MDLTDDNDVRSGFARTDDGLELYWRAVGTGEPALVCCNGVGVSTFFFKYVVEHFRDRHRVVVWDYRGHGRSSLPPEPIDDADLSIDRCAKDLACVLEAAGVTAPPLLLGHSMGCQVILEYALRHPEGTAGLVPMFGTFSRPLDTFMDSPYSRRAFDTLHRVARWGGKGGARMLLPLYDSPIAFSFAAATGLLDKHYAGRTDIDKYLEHLAMLDPRIFLRMVSQAGEHDIEAELPDIAVPVLVIAGEKDLFTPLHRSTTMAERIPGAELMVLAEASHAAIVEHPASINLRIERFLRERVFPATAQRVTAASNVR
ncbi:MAG: alpha/beta hydrolase [Alphaproteobacteria bacterium]|nr:alpha/beta hydrolase [Alphaproteobacteria bacterium]